MAFRDDVSRLKDCRQELDQRLAGFNKQAFDLATSLELAKNNWQHILEVGAAAKGGVYALQRAAQHASPSFSRAAVELGAQGRKLGPFTHDLLRILTGKRGLEVYNKNRELGQYLTEKGVPQERVPTVLEQLAENVDRYNPKTSPQARGPVQDQLTDMMSKREIEALSKIHQGKGDGKIKQQLVRNSVPESAPRHIGHDLVQLPHVALSPFTDSRMAFRPVLNTVQQHEPLNRFFGRIGNAVATGVNKLPDNVQHPLVYAAHQIKKPISWYVD